MKPMNALSKILSLVHFTKLPLLVFFIFYNLMHGTEHINVLKFFGQKRLHQPDALLYFATQYPMNKASWPVTFVLVVW